MFLSVLERQKARWCDHTVVWQRYCRKVTFDLDLIGFSAGVSILS